MRHGGWPDRIEFAVLLMLTAIRVFVGFLSLLPR